MSLTSSPASASKVLSNCWESALTPVASQSTSSARPVSTTPSVKQPNASLASITESSSKDFVNAKSVSSRTVKGLASNVVKDVSFVRVPLYATLALFGH